VRGRAQQALWKIVCTLCFWTGIVPLFGWRKRRRCGSSWTVLTYHRVGREPACGGPDVVSCQRFRQHLRYLRRRYEIVPVGEAFQRQREGAEIERPLLSVTFDDGYRDNLTAALPILVQEGIRATLYAAVSSIRDNVAPWPHRLVANLRALASQSRSATTEREIRSDLLRTFRQRTARAGKVADGRLRREVARAMEQARRLPDIARIAICEEASRLSGDRGERVAEMLSAGDLLEWQRAGMEVASHTWAHSILSRVSPAARRRDLIESRRWLEDVVGKPVVHLAYPNGGEDDFDDQVARDARATGFLSAMTTLEGANAPGADRLRLRRISVGNDAVPVLAARVCLMFTRLRRWLKLRGRAKATNLARGGSRTDTARNDPATPRLAVAFIGGRGVGSAYSGIERYYEEVGSRLAARGHRVLVYCRSHFTPPGHQFRGIEVRRIPTLRSKHLETFLHTLLSTIDVSFRRVDVVQFHALGSSPFAWIPRIFGKRCVVSVRGLDWRRAKWGWLARTYLRLCERSSVLCPHATVTVSKTLQKHFEERFRRPVSYIPNGVARHERLPLHVIRRWGLKDRGYLLYAGRLSPEKGLETLIEAHRGVSDRCKLVIAGGDSYSQPYIERLKSMAGAGDVVFTGFVTGRVLHELYAHALAFVLPSQMEGLSVALLEALSYGLPVVATDIPENRELLDECGGVHFPVGDTEALAAVLRRILDDPQQAAHVGERARERVEIRFAWDRIVLETERLYIDLIQGARPRETGDAEVVRSV